MTLKVICKDSHHTLVYAAEELRRCLSTMTSRTVELSFDESQDGIRVGLLSNFTGISPMEVADPVVDDAIAIDVRETSGYISGLNPRSTLLAVYRYLTELGCRWVRPGSEGEYIPRRDSLPPVSLRETPSYRHRGICIEGAVSDEHVREIVDWMPKLGFNGYFIQFREAHTFFDRWYSRPAGSDRISVDEARAHTARAVSEIKKRDLLYHAVGHGWTCEPFGIGGLGWDTDNSEQPEHIARYLAEVNGERKLWGGVAINTNLCYGNPEARRMVVEEIANYAQSHPDIDIMHFWLADGSNNNCECDLCKDTRPSDLYVRMLNELDDLMTARKLKTRIVFLVYVDLLWPPETEVVANPDRFILMFAPITRTYSKSFAAGSNLPALPPFERNKLKCPSSVDENVAFLRAWQDGFSGDSFDFDYHMMWDHYKDPTYTPIAKVLAEDIKGLSAIGLDGYVSCQVQRSFFPTGLPMTVLGRTLWNSATSYDEIAADYFDSAYGADGSLVRGYLEDLSKLLDPVYLRGEKPEVSEDIAEAYARIPALVEKFAPIIERNMGDYDACRAKSWLYLKHSAQLTLLFAAACEARARGDKQSAFDCWQEAVKYVTRYEPVLSPVLDVSSYIGSLSGLFPAPEDA